MRSPPVPAWNAGTERQPEIANQKQFGVGPMIRSLLNASFKGMVRCAA